MRNNEQKKNEEELFLPRLSWSREWTAVADNMNNCLHNISGLVPPVALPLQLREPF